ncbi:MAG TPA: hypothetical protein DIU15_14470 [Deltaproteobacteria bacterium]|nr:hypothetical protein [Deltaproteobacteria bacterium]HCP47243.1 hypothetical protein [Deltaproteobacteria bacterium]
MADEQTNTGASTEEIGGGTTPPTQSPRRPVIKKRVSRKERQEELEQPDEFIEVGGTVIDWLIERGKIVSGIVGGLLLLVIVWAVVDKTQAATSEDAAAALYDAVAELPAQSNQSLGGISLALTAPDDADSKDKVAAAVTALDAVIADYDGTSQAHQAQIVAGRALYDQGDFDQALAYFSAAKAADGLIGLRASNARAHALAALGRHGEAATEYESLRNTTAGSLKEAATLGLARTYEASGDTAKALDIYSQFQTEFPDSEHTQDVLARVAAHATP